MGASNRHIKLLDQGLNGCPQWIKYSLSNPHLTIYIAIHMPSEDIKNLPAGVWSAPFLGSDYCWCIYSLDDLLSKANDTVLGSKCVLGLWRLASSDRRVVASTTLPEGGIRPARNFRARKMKCPLLDKAPLILESNPDSDFEASDDTGNSTDGDE